MEAWSVVNRALLVVLGLFSLGLAGLTAVGVMRPKRKPREGWEEAFREMHARGDDEPLIW
jgi:hypothetical protein